MYEKELDVNKRTNINKIWLIATTAIVTIVLSAGGYVTGKSEANETFKHMCDKVGVVLIDGKVYTCDKE